MERDIEVNVLYTFKDPKKNAKPVSENEEISEMIDKVRHNLTYRVYIPQEMPKVEEGESIRINLDAIDAMNSITERLRANKRRQKALSKELTGILSK